MADEIVSRPNLPAGPETAGFFGSPPHQIAATTHAPPEATAGVLICPSLFTEALRNFRREVVLARSLSARGIAAQRFHYRGTGNSGDCDDAGMTFDGLCDDARFASDLLGTTTCVTHRAFLGTRFGALVAARIAAESPGAPLVLIEPVLEARKFFREGLRSKVMSGFKSTGGATKVGGLLAELEAVGAVDVLGDELEWSLYQSAQDTTLLEEMGTVPRPVLIVQLGADDPVRAEYQRLVDASRAIGCQVDVRKIGARSAWWFLDERDPVGVGALRSQGLDGADDLVAAVESWLSPLLVKEHA